MLTNGKAWMAAAALSVAFTATAQAAPITYTYSYDTDTVNLIAIRGEPYHTPSEMNDGIIPVSDVPWDENGAIFCIGDPSLYAPDALPKPRIIIDLGGEYDLGSITIYYMVRQGSGVNAPVSVDIKVDDAVVPQFTGFDNSPFVEGNANRSVTIDLTGYTGSTIDLDFRHNHTEWLGLSEIIVNDIPEPASLALIGLGGLLMFKRRRH